MSDFIIYCTDWNMIIFYGYETCYILKLNFVKVYLYWITLKHSKGSKRIIRWFIQNYGSVSLPIQALDDTYDSLIYV